VLFTGVGGRDRGIWDIKGRSFAGKFDRISNRVITRFKRLQNRHLWHFRPTIDIPHPGKNDLIDDWLDKAD
jgi:hypothetical protein